MKGKIFLVGIGPGNERHMTVAAIEALKMADVVVGYGTYLALIEDFTAGKEIISKGMAQEVERVRCAVKEAMKGRSVALVSSGDPGVYAMGGILFQYLKENGINLDVEVVPGVTAANAVSALLGSPLSNDFAVISLSDRLTPWKDIEKRLRHAAEGDFCLVLYNPKSKEREQQFRKAIKIVMEYRDAGTPVGIVRNAMRDREEVKITTLSKIPYQEVDMLTTVIVGNSSTFIDNNRMVTPRGYELKYDLRG